MMSAFVGSGLPMPSAMMPLTAYQADNALIHYSDYALLSVNSIRARFSRYADPYSQGFETAAPGARVRISTSSRLVHFRLQYTDLVTRLDTYNGVGAVLVDGALFGNFDRARLPAGPVTVVVEFGSAAPRTIELLMPYCASVDLLGVDIQSEYTLTTPAARPSVRYVAVGDSITHGFVTSRGDLSWPQRLAALKGWQQINMGYGGHEALPLVVQAAAGLSPTVGTYLIGYNNFGSQTALATFKSNFKAAVMNWRAAAPAARLYCITPLYSPNTDTLTLENYRQQIRDGIAELGDPLSTVVEGLPLAPNDSASFPDNVHPSDAASQSIATALAAVVNV